MFSTLILCDDLQEQQLIRLLIIVMHCIILKDKSLQRTFSIINDTKFKILKKIDVKTTKNPKKQPPGDVL